MQNSSIEWTDHTFNLVWGCQRVSPGCQHCYAETLAKRYGFDVWGPAKNTERRVMSDNYWKQPARWNAAAEKAGKRARVFCCSMADVFEDHPTNERERTNKLWPLIEATPWLDWQLLTKRPENINQMIPLPWRAHPPKNVWYGTSVEDQQRVDERIEKLLQVNAWVRFLSCEPMLGPVRLPSLATPWKDWRRCGGPGIHWVICGGESGHGARPIRKEWAQCLQMDCERTGIAFFFKQWGEYVPAWSNDGAPFWLDNGSAFDPGETWPHPRIHTWESGRVPHTEDLYYCSASVRVGKHAAGRLLDGVEWNEMPA